MLRSCQRLLKFSYGYTGGDYRQYSPLIPWQTEKLPIQKQFKPGDNPQYVLDSKLKFHQDYKPYELSASNHGFLISVCFIFGYLSLRYERIREKSGIKQTHQYPI